MPRYQVKTKMELCLWGCFWKRLAFDLADWAEITFISVGMHHPICQEPKWSKMAEEGPICSLSLSWNIHFSFLETLELLVLGPLNSGRIIPLDFPVPQFVNYGIYRPPYHIDGEKMKTLPDFIFLGSKITVDGDCSHKIKRHLLLGRKAMANPDSILKSRDHFDDKGPHSGSYGFSSSYIWMWVLDSEEGLSSEKLLVLNCDSGEDFWEFLGL